MNGRQHKKEVQSKKQKDRKESISVKADRILKEVREYNCNRVVVKTSANRREEISYHIEEGTLTVWVKNGEQNQFLVATLKEKVSQSGLQITVVNEYWRPELPVLRVTIEEKPLDGRKRILVRGVRCHQCLAIKKARVKTKDGEKGGRPGSEIGKGHHKNEAQQ